MKRSIIAVILLLSTSVFAAQKPINQLSWGAGTIKPSTMQSTINAEFADIQANFAELYAFDSTVTTALNSKAAISCFTNASTMAACFPDLSVGGDNLGSATSSSVVALFSGTGDCLGANGQKVACGSGTSFDQAGDYTLSGTVGFTGPVDFSGATVTGITGTVPTGTENQIPVYDSSGTLTATTPLTPVAGQNITLTTDTTAGTVTIASSGGATYPGAGIPQSTGSAWGSSITPGAGVATALAAAVDGTGGLASKAALDAVTAGSFAFDTYPTYEDSAHTGSGIAVNGTTLAVYSPAAAKWLTVGLTDSLDPTPDTTPDAFTFGTTQADAVLSTQYCSAPTTPTGFTSATSIVSTGTGSNQGWKIDGGSFATTGTLSPGSAIQTCHDSSASNSQSTTSSLTIGGVAATAPFTVTTVAAPQACSTQSVLLTQSGNVYNREIYGNAIAARVTGNGKQLYSVKGKTGGVVGGTGGTWMVYVNTALDFDGTVTDSFSISPPSTTYTEFSALSSSRPVLENGTNYYVAFGNPGGNYNTRRVFNALSGSGTTPVNNLWQGPIGGTFTQDSGASLWIEVKTCD